MHELSIAASMVEIAAETARANGGGRVAALYLKLGALSGVVRDALEFSWRLAAEGTAVEGARLVIEEVPLVVHCPQCDAERALDSLNRFVCPVCAAATPQIVRGRELQITAVEIL